MNRATVAGLLAFLGTLCMLAMAFDILPDQIALFAGIALYMASGLAWWLPVGRGGSDR